MMVTAPICQAIVHARECRDPEVLRNGTVDTLRSGTEDAGRLDVHKERGRARKRGAGTPQTRGRRTSAAVIVTSL